MKHFRTEDDNSMQKNSDYGHLGINNLIRKSLRHS